MKIPRNVALALSASILLTGCGEAPVYRVARLVMGTTASVEIPLKSGSAEATGRYCRKALDEITRLDNIFSLYISGSDIDILNKQKRLSAPREETWQVLSMAGKYYMLTGGAFDITIGAIEEAWKAAAQYGGVPDAARIEEALSHSGTDKIVIDETDYEVYLPDEHMIVDLGGIAKGYAADRSADLLRSIGVKNAIVNIGGDIMCLGRRRPGRKWRIGIRDPLSDMPDISSRSVTAGIIAMLELEDVAVATSGDYENYQISGGKRYSHIIDPRTGQALSSDISSVTVIADACAAADALATAVSVLGVEDGLALIDSLSEAECYIVSIDRGVMETHMSDGMERYLQ